MALSKAQATVNEDTTAIYQCTLQDENGDAVYLSQITTITLTYYNLSDGTIINSRSDQTVLNTNGVTIVSTGGLTWTIAPADTIIVGTDLAAGQLEQHRALFRWYWGTEGQGRHEVDLYVRQINETPISIGSTLVYTWGGSSSDSYVSVTMANSFITYSMLDNSAWKNATEIQKEAACREATKQIDFAAQYIGGRYYDDQRLAFPRAFDVDWPYSSTEIGSTLWSVQHEQMQEDVRQATCYQIVWLLKNSGTPDRVELGASGVSKYSKRVGPVAETYEFGSSSAAAAASRVLSPDVRRLLGRWMTTNKIFRA